MSSKTLPVLLDKMWQDYISLNPMAKKIHDLIEAEAGPVQNDHIALRTFNHPRVGIDVIAQPFLELGYTYKGDYQFPEKKLYAKHYEHRDPTHPKIFISELLLEKFSLNLQDTITTLVEKIPPSAEKESDFACAGRPWPVSTKTYHTLLRESDYAAWVAAFGYRPNHFTVFLNGLNKFSEIQRLNDFLKDHGFKLNASGGEVKGSPEVFLEQSSTLANNVVVKFTDGELTIPGCYYEFARRYALPHGSLYQGFVAASADKIFESTSRGQ